jgi:hypothetical protein
MPRDPSEKMFTSCLHKVQTHMRKCLVFFSHPSVLLQDIGPSSLSSQNLFLSERRINSHHHPRASVQSIND